MLWLLLWKSGEFWPVLLCSGGIDSLLTLWPLSSMSSSDGCGVGYGVLVLAVAMATMAPSSLALSGCSGVVMERSARLLEEEDVRCLRCFCCCCLCNRGVAVVDDTVT